MEQFKSISDYPCEPCVQLAYEKVALYDNYIAEGIRQSVEIARADLLARTNRNIIHFHSGR